MNKCSQVVWYNYEEKATIIKLILGSWHCLTVVIQDGKATDKSLIRFKLPKILGGEIVLHHFSKELKGVDNSDLYFLYKEVLKEYFDAHPDKKVIMQEYHLGKALKWCN